MASTTVPRGPIAAMYSSPGPCYALPHLVGQRGHDPRSVHRKGPAYSLSSRSGKFINDCSPGPAYLPDASYTRIGKKGDPQYSIYSRPRDMSRFRTPGPGAYSPENSTLTSPHQKMPSYSFGKKYLSRKTDSTPGANAYQLPSMMGENIIPSDKPGYPAISLTGRGKLGFAYDYAKSPGPGTYRVTHPNIHKTRAPGYSMTSRNMMPGDATRKPGPGTYYPENVTKSKQEAPKFSFGIRHSPFVAPLIVDPLSE